MLIPVNAATLPFDINAIKQRLDKLYAPAIVEWSVITDKQLEISQIEESDFNTTGVSMLSKYTNDMRKVNNAYVSISGYIWLYFQ